jgi:N-sulfoglucosamine sulfohydrolase
MVRRNFLAGLGTAVALTAASRAKEAKRPNILFCIADDWGWPHASIHGDAVVKTPTFDSIARNGILFENAFAIVPSCTPSRNSILTGQYPWRLKTGASLWSVFPEGVQTYPNLLEDAGYHVGSYRKAFGPGIDRDRSVAGEKYKSVDEFFEARPEGKPFCFWFGTSDPHRGYKWQSGIESGMKLEDVEVPPYFPDTEKVRTDICDYYYEVQRFDRETGEVLQRLEEAGELDNTLVLMTGDHGWPFPRSKANLYDSGTHVCLVAQWADRIKADRVVDDFVSFHDFAPTFLAAAGLQPLEVMTGRSLLNIFDSGKSGQIEPQRNHVVLGKERHTPCQPDDASGTPMRAIRTKDFLYIRNFKPECWPAGAPEAMYKDAYFDIDASPTKDVIVEHKDDPTLGKFFELAIAKRPADELYDLSKDPHEINNVAANPEYAKRMGALTRQLTTLLEQSEDPRVLGQGDLFDRYKYLGRTKLSKKKK